MYEGEATPEGVQQTRNIISMMVAMGVDRKKIAHVLNLDERKMAEHYAYELENGAELTNLSVANSLYLKATKGGNVTAQIFWLKARAGWKDNDMSITHKGDFGSALKKALGVQDAANDSTEGTVIDHPT